MSWDIRYRSSVENDIERLPSRIRVAVLKKIVELGENPFPRGCKKLKGTEKRYRLQIAGQYRIVYSLFSEERVLKVEFVGHRKDAYLRL